MNGAGDGLGPGAPRSSGGGAAGADGAAADGLRPGELRAISAAEWFDVLEREEPVHQWGPALLVEDGGPQGLLRLWLRDDEGGRHRVLRLDARATLRAREGLGQVEAAARRVADLLAREQERGGSRPGDLAEQAAASQAYTDLAEALYRELLQSCRPA